MKQHTGDEIRRIMSEMPDAAIAALQAAFLEHRISEREARWWGYPMSARTGAYEGFEYTILVGSSGASMTQAFLAYLLDDRAMDTRCGARRGRRCLRPLAPERRT